jgi:hypothetical protein
MLILWIPIFFLGQKYKEMFPTRIIKDARRATESQRKVMDGIIHSAVLTEFQQEAIDGIVKSAIPEGKRKESVPVLHKTKPGATKVDVGHVHFPGSRY